MRPFDLSLTSLLRAATPAVAGVALLIAATDGRASSFPQCDAEYRSNGVKSLEAAAKEAIKIDPCCAKGDTYRCFALNGELFPARPMALSVPEGQEKSVPEFLQDGVGIVPVAFVWKVKEAKPGKDSTVLVNAPAGTVFYVSAWTTRNEMDAVAQGKKWTEHLSYEPVAQGVSSFGVRGDGNLARNARDERAAYFVRETALGLKSFAWLEHNDQINRKADTSGPDTAARAVLVRLRSRQQVAERSRSAPAEPAVTIESLASPTQGDSAGGSAATRTSRSVGPGIATAGGQAGDDTSGASGMIPWVWTQYSFATHTIPGAFQSAVFIDDAQSTGSAGASVAVVTQAGQLLVLVGSRGQQGRLFNGVKGGTITCMMTNRMINAGAGALLVYGTGGQTLGAITTNLELNPDFYASLANQDRARRISGLVSGDEARQPTDEGIPIGSDCNSLKRRTSTFGFSWEDAKTAWK